MTFFAKVICLLLAATATIAGRSPSDGTYSERVERTADAAEESLRMVCGRAKMAVRTLLLRIELESTNKPKCVDEKCNINDECFGLFQHLVETDRELVHDCSEDYVKIAKNQRDRIKEICSESIKLIRKEPLNLVDSLDELPVKLSASRVEKKLKTALNKMRQNVERIQYETTSLLREKINYAMETTIAWFKDTVRCVGQKGGSELKLKLENACAANRQSSRLQAASSRVPFDNE